MSFDDILDGVEVHEEDERTLRDRFKADLGKVEFLEHEDVVRLHAEGNYGALLVSVQPWIESLLLEQYNERRLEEDILLEMQQEASVAVLEDLPTYDPSKGALSTWTSRVAANAFRDYLKRELRYEQSADLLEIEEPEDEDEEGGQHYGLVYDDPFPRISETLDLDRLIEAAQFDDLELGILDAHRAGYSQADIAMAAGISQQLVSLKLVSIVRTLKELSV